MKMRRIRLSGRNRKQNGITLVEVVLSMAVMGVAIGAIVMGYVLGAARAEWSAYSLAANSLALQGIEQCRAAKYDVLTSPVVDELIPASFPPRNLVMDIPQKGTNIAYATNFTTITQVSTDPPLKMIRVDCVWPFKHRRLFTNTIVTYRAADQ